MSHPEIALFFLFIAFVYASVGFGGGSSYLAVLALYSLPFQEMRLIALLCNIVVVTGGTLIFIRKKQANFKKISPLVVASVPMAFFGASVKISEQTFFIALGISLVLAAVLLWTSTKVVAANAEAPFNQSSLLQNSLIGAVIGFLSGMVGIGGGIFLSPILNLMKWDTPRKIAATASLFILLNSLSGIAGQLMQLPSRLNWTQIIILGVAVFIGGQLGSRMAVQKFNQFIIKRLTAVLVFIAGIEVLVHHLPSFK